MPLQHCYPSLIGLPSCSCWPHKTALSEITSMLPAKTCQEVYMLCMAVLHGTLSARISRSSRPMSRLCLC